MKALKKILGPSDEDSRLFIWVYFLPGLFGGLHYFMEWDEPEGFDIVDLFFYLFLSWSYLAATLCIVVITLQFSRWLVIKVADSIR